MAFGKSPYLRDCLSSLTSQSIQSEIEITTSTPCDYIINTSEAYAVPVIVNPRADGIAADWNFALAATGAAGSPSPIRTTSISGFAARSLALLDALAAAVLCFTGYEEIDDDGAPATSRISIVKHLIEQSPRRGDRVSGGRLRAFLSFGNPLPCSSVTFDARPDRRLPFPGNWNPISTGTPGCGWPRPGMSWPAPPNGWSVAATTPSPPPRG